MFYKVHEFNQPLKTWNTSKVTDMCYMFCGALKFNQPIGSWDTSQVRDMSWMFSCGESFNQDLSKWDVSSVINMTSMFMGSPSLIYNPNHWWTTRSDCDKTCWWCIENMAYRQRMKRIALVMNARWAK